METWLFGLVCNAIIAVVSMLIAVAIDVPLSGSAEQRQGGTRGRGSAT